MADKTAVIMFGFTQVNQSTELYLSIDYLLINMAISFQQQ